MKPKREWSLVKRKDGWEPKFVWHTSWIGDESQLLVYNERWVMGGTNGSGIVAAVAFRLPPEHLRIDRGHPVGYQFEYSPSYLPDVVHYLPLDPCGGDFRSLEVQEDLKPSMKALLRLACDWTEFEGITRLDPENDDGIVTSVKFGPKHDGSLIRNRWIIAWLWPYWNVGKKPNDIRAWEANLFFEACNLDCRITPGTLKTTANRMGLFFK